MLKKSWTTTLVVSPAEIPNLSNCSVINVGYRLKAKALLAFPHSNMKISCPLTFGTIPLTGTNTNTTGSSIQLNSYATAPVNDVTPFLQNNYFPSEQKVGSSAGMKDSAPPSYATQKARYN
ncbi:hypothetical protein ILUMI_12565 [Ignelater luminosus]|uniref:Uncharacterized protein n=1 Tax=Ignelater luminosus TaxID=2038154 RepID=A0A8K0GCU0_IGNLU|nr:hypothetical protein ILUMI_12565 [Ignelater luminosus]